MNFQALTWKCKEIVKQTNGKLGVLMSSFFSWIKCAWICAFIWFTSIKGVFKDRLSDLANDVPTSKEPKSPGPLVNAILVISEILIFAFSKAAETTGTIFSWWALDASSGTTPPYFSWTAWLAVILE